MNKRKIQNGEAPDFGRRVGDALGPDMLALLCEAAELAAELGWKTYLVGGYVRDVLLGRRHYDVDIAVEGDALALATALQERRDALLEATHRFGTAYLEFGGGLHNLDLVTARHEQYPTPGALPVVEAGNIYDDLARRDFTINALAIELRPDGVGGLLDPHDGLSDLQAGLVRVLHPNSFLDDPTRIPRAVKYAGRLDFEMERGTLQLILEAVRDGAISNVSTDRMRNELLLIMEEPKAGAMLARLEHLGVLRAIHPDLAWPYSADSEIGPTNHGSLTPKQRHDTYLAILGAEFASDPEEAERLGRELSLGAHHARLMQESAQLAQMWPRLGEEGLRPSEVYNMLKDLHLNTLHAYSRIGALAADTGAWERLNDYLDHLRHLKPELNGDYLHELGIPPGPIYARVLGELLEAKLDGKLPGREGEEDFVRKLLEG